MKLQADLLGVIALAATIVPLVGQAQEPGPIVAVFDIDDRSKTLDQGTGDLTDYLAVLLTQGGWQVVPRAQIRARLKEAQGESYKACYDQSCQVELGRELAAQKTLSTQIFQVGDECRVTATLYDLRRATTEKAETEKSECNSAKLGLALERLAARITNRIDQAALEKARHAEAERKAQVDEAARQKALAEEAARQKSLADEASRKKAAEDEAARTRPAEEATPDEVPPVAGEGSHDRWLLFGLRAGVITPNLDPAGSFRMVEEGFVDSEISNGVGAVAELQITVVLLRYFSLGVGLAYHDFNLTEDEECSDIPGGPLHPCSNDTTLHLLTPSLRLVGSWPVIEKLELRLTFQAGAAMVIAPTKMIFYDQSNTDFTLQGDPKGSVLLSIRAGLEAAWWIAPSFSLLFGIDCLALPVGKFHEVSSGGDFHANPVLLLTLGGEYGL